MDNPLSDCERCRTCCRFEEYESYFAPIFADSERRRLDAAGIAAGFVRHGRQEDVWQVQLVPEGRHHLCPFLDGESQRCRIYAHRPLDCRIWPFILMRDREEKTVLGHFSRERCPSFRRLSDLQFAERVRRTAEWLRSEAVCGLLREYPGLVWPYDGDAAVLFPWSPAQE
jgi:Fe-S-cluster containining protein